MSRRVYVIAEAGVNHNGSIAAALDLVDAAADAGADAVKFQTFRTEKVVSRLAPKAEYQKKTTGAEESQYEMIKKLELDESAHVALIERCRSKEIAFLSTPFDPESLDMLANRFELPLIKIPSGEITNAPFLLEIARTGKPVIFSTGMSNLEEIEEALGVLAFGYLDSREPPSMSAFMKAFESTEGNAMLKERVILLHCTTEYPAPFGEINLKAMETMRNAFGLPVGYSDHTEGIAVPIAAVALGAVVIEKHFTLDCNLPGPDHKASLEPCELKQMVKSIREVEVALGSSIKQPTASELKNKAVARKSLVAARDISKGTPFSEENLAVKRPGDGINPIRYWEWLGKEAQRDYSQDEQVRD